MCSNEAISDDPCFAAIMLFFSKLSYLTKFIVMLIYEPVYGTQSDVIQPTFNGMRVNIGIDEKNNTKIKIGKISK